MLGQESMTGCWRKASLTWKHITVEEKVREGGGEGNKIETLVSEETQMTWDVAACSRGAPSCDFKVIFRWRMRKEWFKGW